VDTGGTTQFTVSANSGDAISSVTGCGGTLSGTTYITGAVTADCTVVASFVPQFKVTATAGPGGNISPSSAIVDGNSTAQFTVTVNSGYAISSVTGCNGTLSGTTYTTGFIFGNCTVTASFVNHYTVTATAVIGGSISPSSATVGVGGTAQFTVTANSGYAISSVAGCGGTLSGSVYTTGAINANCTVAAGFANQSQSLDATAFQINPMHTGAVTYASVSFPAAPAWSVDVGGTPSYALIADGMVFVTVQLSGTSYPNYSSELYALSQTTGATVWGPIAIAGQANATYDNGRVFVVNSIGVVQAYDAATGALDWTAQPSGISVSAAPTAVDGLVFLGDDGGTLYAIDEATGLINWRALVLNGENSDPAVTSNGVYVTYPCQTYDFTPTTGALVWNNSTGCEGGGGATPVVANSLLYSPNNVGSGYTGTTFDATSGTPAGSFSASFLPSVTTTMGYFLQSGMLQGIAEPTNTVEWSFMGDGSLTGAPLAVNQYVIIASSSGNLYALDGTTGTQVWTQNLGAAVDENSANLPMSGLSLGDGLLVVPVGTKVIAYILSTNP
jgi:outer membrane protein assembly factor BamB